MVSVSVRVSAKAFWFASQFKANNDIRYYLNSVQIKKHPEKGAFVAGCDGHVIGIYHDPLAEFSCEENEIIVSLSADAAKHIKPTSRIKHDRFVSIEGTRAKVVLEGDHELFVNPGNCLVDAKFPDWRRVIPDISTLKIGTPSSFNARLADRVIRAEMGMTPSSSYPMVAFFRKEVDGIIDHSSGVACAFGSDKNAFAYFMPMRSGNAEFMSNAKHAFPMLKGV